MGFWEGKGVGIWFYLVWWCCGVGVVGVGMCDVVVWVCELCWCMGCDCVFGAVVWLTLCCRRVGVWCWYVRCAGVRMWLCFVQWCGVMCCNGVGVWLYVVWRYGCLCGRV